MGVNYTEADYENSVIELCRDKLGYEYIYGPDIERDFYSPLYDSILEESLYSLNRNLPSDAIQDAMYKLKILKWRACSEKFCLYGLFAKWYSCQIFCGW